MRIIGINSSHDTSLAIMQDGEVQELFEEERERREKYYSPNIDSPELHTVNSKGIADALSIEQGGGELIFASFDRRDMKIHFDREYLMDNRLLAEEFARDLSKEQLSLKRIEQLQEEYPKLGINVEWLEDMDETIHDCMANQFDDVEEYHYDTEHHLYHAYSGYFLSPFYQDGQEAIAITWDGGGAKSYHKEYPNFQEIESIFKCTPEMSDTMIVPQWKKYSNHRFLGDLASEYFPNMYYDVAHCQKDLTTIMDGIHCTFSSFPSSGMNFSNMSYAFGADKEGRAAGKVMGMASYGRLFKDRPDRFDRHIVAQMCEEESFQNACNVIRTAIEYNPECKNLVLSGGFSLNCTNNYRYLQEFPDMDIFVDPVPHDGGTAVGAAFWLHTQLESGIDGVEIDTTEGEV